MNGKYKFAVITVILSGIIIFCTTQTVLAQGKSNQMMDAKYYRRIEQDYVKRVRVYLNEEGYENSGVTLTKVIESDGERTYTLKIHHKRMDYLDVWEKEVLKAELFERADGLLTENFSQEFLEIVF